MQNPKENRKFLGSYCASDHLLNRIEFLQQSDVDDLEMQRGILILMAFWSGPSVVGFKNVCRMIADTGLPDDFVFRVLDIDGLSRPALGILSRQPVVIGGNAESYLFLNGSIVSAGNCQSLNEEFIRQILTGGRRTQLR